MHGNGEFGGIQGTALLGVGQEPNTTQNLIREPGAFEYLFCDFAYRSISKLVKFGDSFSAMKSYPPEITPFLTSDFSNSETNLLASSG